MGSFKSAVSLAIAIVNTQIKFSYTNHRILPLPTLLMNVILHNKGISIAD